jgi:UDP-N-acetylglucosamine 2-epimerase (non-hydrolysing)
MAVPAGVMPLPPLAYPDFLGLLAHARLVATDSGGVQEEASALDLPCLTLRPSTERPVTLEAGSARLVAAGTLPAAVAEVLAGHWPRARPIPLWDGQAGARMVAHLVEALERLPATPAPGSQSRPLYPRADCLGRMIPPDRRLL